MFQKCGSVDACLGAVWAVEMFDFAALQVTNEYCKVCSMQRQATPRYHLAGPPLELHQGSHFEKHYSALLTSMQDSF